MDVELTSRGARISQSPRCAGNCMPKTPVRVMPEDRVAVLWGLVAAHAAAAGHRVSVADVCAVAVRSAEVSGAWVAAAGDQGPDFVICVTDPVAEQLAELQLTLGEGPCHDVLASAAPVLAADLGERAVRSALAGVRAPGAPARRGGGLRVPADDRGDPGRGDGPVPQLSRPAAGGALR